MLRMAEQDRSLGFSFPSLNRSGANINTLYRTAGPERHVWGKDTLSLNTSLPLLCYTSKLIMMPTVIRKWESERRS